ncbi:cytochrome c-type biogenesis protein CcmE [Tistlia consotensis]|uniref:Cytochrome c-type biogenesis protein CcmE n=1 Tax=Tistlia consotensis USBA 355 TaxID=560819 RepID=A0A1Y6BPP0_9PROT|nr:cytochrome c maturation protein CcmE [Tistlia consotensis]SMF11842.1 cytochrome c-type biogenesis protein CcmE [Tistlia consotensis USBA 355]SNR51611.1 cytochrome c-type biogenesis protein CcmE [Tistlia consotensis]
MTRKRRRLIILLLAMLSLGTATALVLSAFNDNLVFFYSPSQLMKAGLPSDRLVRIGGLVVDGSVQKGPGSRVAFSVTDTNEKVPVVYDGILPDLFREGQGVVVQGRMQPDGSFKAVEVLAKHDEKYMPPEVAEALKQSGEWRRQGGEAGAAAGQKESTTQ